MQKLSFHILLLVFIFTGLFISCKPTVPGKYIQPDDFEDILYDRYVAQAMAANEGEWSEEFAYKNKLYWLAVLKKHDVTEAEFDSSLVYYTRNSNMLLDMYKNLTRRLQEEAMALGAQANDFNRFGMASVGDTANIWSNERSVLLMQYAPYNTMSYSIKADTAFHKGDRMIFSFDTKFVFQDGYKDGMAMLAVRFGNDSIVNRNIRISSDSHYTLDIMDNGNLGIKEVKGFIHLSRGKEATATTLKLLFVDNISLVRMHQKDMAEEKKDGADSTGVKKVGDSLGVELVQVDDNSVPLPEKNSRKKWKPQDSKDMPLTR